MLDPRTIVRTIALCVLTLSLAACMPNYSDGSRVGTVTKLSYKGLIWKSWEGEMVMGGVRQNQDENGNLNTVANVFAFNVDPDAVEKVRKAQESGRPVKLIYRQWWLSPLTIQNDHVVIDVQ